MVPGARRWRQSYAGRMREYTAPETVTIADDFNVVSALFERESREPDAKAFAIREGDHFVDVTLGAFCDEVRVMAAGIVGLGIEPGSAICLFSHTRYEFTILDYAILAAGCVTVPIYETDAADQVKWAATNSGAVAIVVENTTLERNVDAVAAELPAVRHTLLIDGGGLDTLRAAAKDVDPSEVEKRWKAITHDQLASIVYTSGTTGLPKGCVLTHGNFASEVGGVAVLMEALLNEQATTLMFLPLAHVLARVVQFACVTKGVQLGYSRHRDPDRGAEALPADVPVRGPEGVREGVQRRAGPGRRWPQDEDLRPGGRRLHRLLEAAAGRARCRRSPRRSTGCSTSSSTASSAPPWAARSATPSPAARRSACASGTSSTAWACRCSRATASPRPPRPRR